MDASHIPSRYVNLLYVQYVNISLILLVALWLFNAVFFCFTVVYLASPLPPQPPPPTDRPHAHHNSSVIIVSLAHAYTCTCIHALHVLGLLIELYARVHLRAFTFQYPEKYESWLPEEES